MKKRGYCFSGKLVNLHPVKMKKLKNWLQLLSQVKSALIIKRLPAVLWFWYHLFSSISSKHAILHICVSISSTTKSSGLDLLATIHHKTEPISVKTLLHICPLDLLQPNTSWQSNVLQIFISHKPFSSRYSLKIVICDFPHTLV